MTVQRQNEEQAEILSARFQQRSEPNFAIANLLSSFLILPELRGLWGFGSVNESGNALDHSGQGRTLTNTGTITRSVLGLLPYYNVNGLTQYWSRADEAGLDITGALTFGGWYNFDSLASTMTTMSKWTAAGNQRAYLVQALNTGAVSASISTDGTAVVSAPGTAGEIVIDQWYFMAGRFTPGAELASFVNLTKHTNAVGIPATIFNSSAALLLGGVSAAAAHNGHGAVSFVCAAALNDAILNNLYEQTKVLFGY